MAEPEVSLVRVVAVLAELDIALVTELDLQLLAVSELQIQLQELARITAAVVVQRSMEQQHRGLVPVASVVVVKLLRVAVLLALEQMVLAVAVLVTTAE
jgi:hypothetical protein